MKTFMVKYTFNRGLTIHTELVSAKDYTDAYLQTFIKFPLDKDVSIIELFEIK